MHVGVARVSENHAGETVMFENRTDPAHVLRQRLRRNGTIFDELHRRSDVGHRRQQRTGRMPDVPELLDRVFIAGARESRRTERLKRDHDRVRQRVSLGLRRRLRVQQKQRLDIGRHVDARCASPNHIKKRPIEQFARCSAESRSASCCSNGGFECRETGTQRGSAGRTIQQLQLHADDQCKRPFAADEQVHQIARLRKLHQRVPRRFLAHAGVADLRNRLGHRGGEDRAHRLRRESADRGHRLRLRRQLGTASDHCAGAVVKYTVECGHPMTHRAVLHGVGTGGVG